MNLDFFQRDHLPKGRISRIISHGLTILCYIESSREDSCNFMANDAKLLKIMHVCSLQKYTFFILQDYYRLSDQEAFMPNSFHRKAWLYFMKN